MYKTILVHVDADDPSVADRVNCAAQIARDHRAMLIGAAAALPKAAFEIVAAGVPIFSGGVMAGDPHELEGRFKTASSEFNRWTSGFGIETEWRTAVDFPASGLAGMAGAADLIVVGGGGSTGGDGDRFVDCGDLVMNAGRPVLRLPNGVSRLAPGGAVVAWRNTREARRALSDALPLLAVAEQVILVHVREAGPKDDPSLADARAFLSSHSIPSEVRHLELEFGNLADEIIDYAERSRSSLIVAGAYGHPRIREWVFGGVTRDLLKDCPIPCLLSR